MEKQNRGQQRAKALTLQKIQQIANRRERYQAAKLETMNRLESSRRDKAMANQEKREKAKERKAMLVNARKQRAQELTVQMGKRSSSCAPTNVFESIL